MKNRISHPMTGMHSNVMEIKGAMGSEKGIRRRRGEGLEGGRERIGSFLLSLLGVVNLID